MQKRSLFHGSFWKKRLEKIYCRFTEFSLEKTPREECNNLFTKETELK